MGYNDSILQNGNLIANLGCTQRHILCINVPKVTADQP